jgi:hypothetical protein
MPTARVPERAAYTARDGSRKRPLQHPKPGTLDEPVIQRDDDTGIWRVRLLRHVHEGHGLYMGKPLIHQHEVYLDGWDHARTYGNGRITKRNDERLAPMAAITAARTKDVIDYGRFIAAATALVRASDAAGHDPSPEQLESLLQSYQGLIAWREDLNAKIQQIDGALDVAAAKVRQAIG